MAADTCIMRLRVSIHQRIIMTGGTGGRIYFNARMNKRCCRMQRLPGIRMTRYTVTASAEGRIMSAISRYKCPV